MKNRGQKGHRRLVDVNKKTSASESPINKNLKYIMQILETVDQRIHNLEMGNTFTSSVEIYRADVREIFLNNQPVGDEIATEELREAIQFAFDAADMIELEFSKRMKLRLEEAIRKQEEEKKAKSQQNDLISDMERSKDATANAEEKFEESKVEDNQR